MLENEAVLFITETLLSYLLFFVFVFTGKFTLNLFKASDVSYNQTTWGRLFYHFLAGLLLVITLYSILLTRGTTVNILIIPVFFFIFKKSRSQDIALNNANPQNAGPYPFAEVGLITLLCMIVLHVFPESEYKQADSFFYLKIAESLNAAGQENISHYYNLYNSNFNGVEPYHYFEIWITAFITRFTSGFLPSIDIQRFVGYGLMLTGVIAGLYQLVEVIVQKKLQVSHKIFCWCLLFIFPNLLGFFPWLYHVFISDFEGNILDRPNFRILYLFLIPVISELLTHGALTKRSIGFLLLLSVVSFQFFLVGVPAMFLYAVWLFVRKDQLSKIIALSATALCMAFAAFYALFSVKNIPSFFGTGLSSFVTQTLHGSRFILFSIVTSFLYVVIIFFLLILPLFFLVGKRLFVTLKELSLKVFPLIVIGFVGLIMARVLYLKDNAYQFIFLTHILTTFFAWMVYVVQLRDQNNPGLFLGSALYLSLLWITYWVTMPGGAENIFRQNGKFVYEGKKYSNNYINGVKEYFKSQQPGAGAYLADSAFYSQTYYSRRNPNVYFLPITYIVTNNFNRNIEFCLSDTSAIKYQVDNPVFKEYLHNAISRSLFFRYRLQNPSLTYYQAVTRFVNDHHLAYLVVTSQFPVDKLELRVIKELRDLNTGERFLVLN